MGEMNPGTLLCSFFISCRRGRQGLIDRIWRRSVASRVMPTPEQPLFIRALTRSSPIAGGIYKSPLAHKTGLSPTLAHVSLAVAHGEPPAATGWERRGCRSTPTEKIDESNPPTMLRRRRHSAPVVGATKVPQLKDRMAETVPATLPSFALPGFVPVRSKEQRRAEIESMKPPPEPEEWRSDDETEREEDAAAIRARSTAKLYERSVRGTRAKQKRGIVVRRVPRECTP